MIDLKLHLKLMWCLIDFRVALEAEVVSDRLEVEFEADVVFDKF